MSITSQLTELRIIKVVEFGMRDAEFGCAKGGSCKRGGPAW
jgi:hypothetical protein